MEKQIVPWSGARRAAYEKSKLDPKERRCPLCSVQMTVDNTPLRTSGRFKSYCYTCSAEYLRTYKAAYPEKKDGNIRNRRARGRAYTARIAFIKAERPCYDCGGNFPPEAMDFDHVRGEKSFGIGQGGNHNWHVVMEEIDKCQLVCANCHRVRTRKRLNSG